MAINEVDLWSVAQEAAEVPSDADPRENQFGFFSCNDRHPTFGGGFGSFLWFPSQVAALDFLGDHVVLWHSLQADDQAPSLQSSVKGLVEKMGGDLAGLRSQFNKVLEGTVQISWIGTFDELLSGQGEFERGVRSRFNEDKSPDPIAPSEIDDFVGFLIDYGI